MSLFAYLDQAPTGFIVLDRASFTVRYANPVVKGWFAVEVGDVFEVLFPSLLHRRVRRRIAAGKDVKGVVRTDRTAEGELDLQLHIAPILSEGKDELLVHVADLSALSERVAILESFATEAELSRKQSERRLSSFPEQNPNPVVATDPSGEVTYQNPGARDLVQALGLQTVYELLPANHREIVQSLCSGLSAPRVVEVDVEGRSVRWGYHRPEGALVVHLYGTEITDIRQAEARRQEAQAQLSRSQRMQSVGQLAGGIAHDFNNILSAIAGYAELSVQDVSVSSSVRENLEHILQAARRAATITSRILTFSRGQKKKREPVVLDVLVREVLALLRVGVPAHVELVQDTQGPLGTEAIVLCDPGQLHQIIVNLVTNAAQAIPETGGRVEVAVKLVPGESPDSVTSVQLIVSDTGKGIDEDTLEHVFEPYFSTKPAGEGTGLGLSVVHGLVEDLGGTIVATSVLGEGSRFCVTFPRAGTVTVEVAKAPETNQDGKANRRILVVDDETLLTRLMDRRLSAAGHHPVSFNDPKEALEAFREQPDSFDLVVTDFSMPGLTGLALTRELLTIRADLPVIVCTGYGKALDLAKVQDYGGRHLLWKPLQWDEFLGLVSQV